jgi:hypothetical protein
MSTVSYFVGEDRAQLLLQTHNNPHVSSFSIFITITALNAAQPYNTRLINALNLPNIFQSLQSAG